MVMNRDWFMASNVEMSSSKSVFVTKYQRKQIRNIIHFFFGLHVYLIFLVNLVMVEMTNLIIFFLFFLNKNMCLF